MFVPLANILTTGLWPAVYLLLIALGPLIFFTWVIHIFERMMQTRLAMRFGWNSVMITGWLGTPIHELSHALMCLVFQHKIVEMELFKPDKKNGRLGYVTHTYQRGNFFQELGNFFIGVAPLAGGTTALLLLLMVFFPEVGRNSLFSAASDLPLWTQVGNSLQGLFSGLFEVSNLASIKLWVFLYLVICVGSHMAPSMSDYEGGFKGGLMLLILLVLTSIIVSVVGPSTSTMVTLAKPVLVPLISILIAVILLCGLATAVVFGLTELIKGSPSR